MSDNQTTDAKMQRKRAPKTAPPSAAATNAAVRQAPQTALVEMVVLKKGAGRISTGVHVAGEGDEFFGIGDSFMAPADAVDELEDRGFAQTK